MPRILKYEELTEEDKVKVNNTMKYPKIDCPVLVKKYLKKYKHIDDPFLNIPLVVEVKRDGSNMRLRHLRDDCYGLMSRNQYACNEFIDKVTKVIEKNPSKYEGIFRWAKSKPCIVFFELWGKGNSPTGFGRDHEPEIEVFDVWLLSHSMWASRINLDQYDNGFPVVPLITETICTSDDEFNQLIAASLVYCQKEHQEGIVIKGNHPTVGRIFTKAKVPEALEAPKRQRVHKRLGKPELPLLELTEVMGAINKVHAQIGYDLWQKKIAMPIIAVAIKEEAEKHERSMPRNIFQYYLDYLEKQEQY